MIVAPGVRAARMRSALLASMTRLERTLYFTDRELQRAARLLWLIGRRDDSPQPESHSGDPEGQS